MAKLDAFNGLESAINFFDRTSESLFNLAIPTLTSLASLRRLANIQYSSETTAVPNPKHKDNRMPYNQELEKRIKKIVSNWKGTQDKKMFGGVCHLLTGNIFCGVHKDFLILRLGQERSDEALKLPHTRPFDITGKKMNGWVMLEPNGYKSDDELKSWLVEAKEFAKTLPAK